MAQVYISIGSNHNRQQNIALALARLKKQFGELLLSPIYESKPVDGWGGNYYNLAVGFQTDLPPVELRNALRQIETQLGRERDSSGHNSSGDNSSGRSTSGHGSHGGSSDRSTSHHNNPGEVSIDLDLLLHDQLAGQFANVELPHPDLVRHRHVLQPLADIAGNIRLPGTTQTLHALLNEPPMANSALEPVTAIRRYLGKSGG